MKMRSRRSGREIMLARARGSILNRLSLAKRYAIKRKMSPQKEIFTNMKRRDYVTQAFRLALRIKDMELARELKRVLIHIHTSNINSLARLINNSNNNNNNNNNNYNNNNN